MAKHVSIENGIIDQMVKNKAFVDSFPFLTHAVSRRPTAGRSCCGGGGGVSVDYGMVKRAVAGMGSADRTKLKGMLGADVVRVTYRVNGKMETVEFS